MGDQLGAGADQMLAVVQYEQELPVAQVLGQHTGHVARVNVLEPERGRHRPRHQ